MHICVVNYKCDLSGNTGFIRAWHHIVGESPALIFEMTGINYGPVDLAPTDEVDWKCYGNYKSNLYETWNLGTYNGELTVAKYPDIANYQMVIGFDSWRFGGPASNFESMHPLRLSP